MRYYPGRAGTRMVPLDGGAELGACRRLYDRFATLEMAATPARLAL